MITAAAITANAGVFIAWNDLLDMLAAVPRDGLDSHVSSVVRQYIEFARRPAAKPGLADDKLVRELADAIRTIVSAVPSGSGHSRRGVGRILDSLSGPCSDAGGPSGSV